MNTAAIVAGIKTILANEASWTKGTLARDAEGFPVAHNAPSAVCFCLQAALWKVTPQVVGGKTIDYTTWDGRHVYAGVHRAFDALLTSGHPEAAAIQAHLESRFATLPRINDTPFTTLAFIHRLLDEVANVA